MDLRTARFISTLLHPIGIPIWVGLLYFLLVPRYYNPNTIYIVMIIIFTSSVVIPLFVLYILKKGQVIETFKLSHYDERKFPLVVLTILGILLGRMFYKMQVTIDLAVYFMGGALALLFTYGFLWRRHKLSLHTLALGSAIGYFMFLSMRYHINYLWLILVLFVLFGIVGKARVDMGAHNVKETINGLLIGIGAQLIFPLMLQNI